MTTVDTAVTSSPGDTVTFNDVTRSVAESVAALTALGVNKIIVLSHIGYDEDVKLAHSVAGIDVVVGGHSHTLLGDPAQFAPLGIIPVDETLKGPYPTVVTGRETRPRWSSRDGAGPRRSPPWTSTSTGRAGSSPTGGRRACCRRTSSSRTGSGSSRGATLT